MIEEEYKIPTDLCPWFSVKVKFRRKTCHCAHDEAPQANPPVMKPEGVERVTFYSIKRMA